MKSHYKKFLTYQNFLAAEFGEIEFKSDLFSNPNFFDFTENIQR